MSDPHMTVWIGRAPFDRDSDVRFNWFGQAGGEAYGPGEARRAMAVALAVAGLDPAPGTDDAAVKASQAVDGMNKQSWALRDRPARGIAITEGEMYDLLRAVTGTDPHIRHAASSGAPVRISLARWRKGDGSTWVEVDSGSPVHQATTRALLAIGLLSIGGADGRWGTAVADHRLESASARAAAAAGAPRALAAEAVLLSAGQAKLAEGIALQAETRAWPRHS